MTLNDVMTSTPRPTPSSPSASTDRSALSGSPPRRIGRPRSLPSGRALLGGVLVAVAMVAAVALSRATGAPEPVPTVVAATTIAPGDALGPHNLVVAALALPDDVVDRTYADIGNLSGTVARSHLAEGDLLQRGAVVESTAAQRAAAPSHEVSLRIDLDRAVDGRLEAGDRIDVLATYGNGLDAATFVVLSDTAVLSATRVDGSVAAGRTLTLTLALDDRADAVSLAHAVDNADITVVRTTTVTGAHRPPGLPFRPDPAGPGIDEGSSDDSDGSGAGS